MSETPKDISQNAEKKPEAVAQAPQATAKDASPPAADGATKKLSNKELKELKKLEKGAKRSAKKQASGITVEQQQVQAQAKREKKQQQREKQVQEQKKKEDKKKKLLNNMATK